MSREMWQSGQNGNLATMIKMGLREKGLQLS
jgi:hypothetical protein